MHWTLAALVLALATVAPRTADPESGIGPGRSPGLELGPGAGPGTAHKPGAETEIQRLTGFFTRLELKFARERGVPAIDEPDNRKSALIAARTLGVPVPVRCIVRAKTSLQDVARATIAPLGPEQRMDLARAISLYERRLRLVPPSVTISAPQRRSAGAVRGSRTTQPRNVGKRQDRRGGTSDDAGASRSGPETEASPPSPALAALRTLIQSQRVFRNLPARGYAQPQAQPAKVPRAKSHRSVVAFASGPRDRDAVPSAHPGAGHSYVRRVSSHDSSAQLKSSASPSDVRRAPAHPVVRGLTSDGETIAQVGAAPANIIAGERERARAHTRTQDVKDDQDWNSGETARSEERTIEACALGKGDRVLVTWHELPDVQGRPVCKTMSLEVSVAGILDVPGLGLLRVIGLTPTQVERRLSLMAAHEDLPRHFTVEAQDSHGAFAYVLGAVGRPGIVPLDGRSIDLVDLIESAGGFTRGADRRHVRILRGRKQIVANAALDGASRADNATGGDEAAGADEATGADDAAGADDATGADDAGDASANEVLAGDRVYIPRRQSERPARLPVIDAQTGWMLYGSPASP